MRYEIKWKRFSTGSITGEVSKYRGSVEVNRATIVVRDTMFTLEETMNKSKPFTDTELNHIKTMATIFFKGTRKERTIQF